MLCGYSNLANISIQHVFFVFFSISGAVCLWPLVTTQRSPRSLSRLWWSYGFTLHCVFSLWKGETELGLLTAGNVGVWCRLRAGNDGSCSFNEHSSKRGEEEKKGKTDTGLVKHHRPHPLLCKAMLKNNMGVMIRFSPQNEIKWWCIYSYVSYRESSQWS